MMKYLTLIILFALAAPVFAVPADYTLNIQSVVVTGEPAEQVRLHESCDLASQTKGVSVLENVSNGDSYSFLGNTDNVYTFCVVGHNVDGNGQELEGAFANVVTIPVLQVTVPPGPATLNVTCQAVPVDGGTAECIVTVNP